MASEIRSGIGTMGDQRNRGEVSAACLKGLGCVENL